MVRYGDSFTYTTGVMRMEFGTKSDNEHGNKFSIQCCFQVSNLNHGNGVNHVLTD
jgi:hypothetical protein